MKVRELIKQLQQTSGSNEVYIETKKGMSFFSIVSFDDIGDVNLCLGVGDELA